MFEGFDIVEFFEGIGDLCKEFGDICNDFVNDIQIIGRDLEKEIREDIEINSIGVPVIEPLVTAANVISDNLKVLGKTISNPLSIGELITDFNKLEEGDHIFVSRVLYTHHGIYVGDNEVIHYAPDYDNICIHKISIYDFAEFGSVFRFNKANSVMRYSPNKVVQRAYSKLYESNYDLIFNNCEHFARWCRCGDKY